VTGYVVICGLVERNLYWSVSSRSLRT